MSRTRDDEDIVAIRAANNRGGPVATRESPTPKMQPGRQSGTKGSGKGSRAVPLRPPAKAGR